MTLALPADADGSFYYRLGRWYQLSGQAEKAQEAFSTASRRKQENHQKELAALLGDR